jgi:cytochrome c peroxidase
MSRPLRFSLLIFALVGIIIACDPRNEIIGPISPTPGDGLDTIAYNPQAYQFPVINGLPAMQIPTDNPVTVAGVRLGKYLFYEKMLSIDSSISCGSCHKQNKAFTDGFPKSIGVDGTVGLRNSMSLINIGYAWRPNNAHNFMWDGKFRHLEEQILAPVENPLEMKNTWEEVERRMRVHAHYPRLFRQAFGISTKSEITKELAAKAMAQFMRTLNSADSKYDSVEFRAFNYFTDEEQRGYELFLGDVLGTIVTKDAECAHCHSFSRNFSTFARNNFSNNGLDSAVTFNDFIDKGLGSVTNIPSDNGRFREVTLRNIGLTAPYMHDGRFATLEEVLNHYVSGGHPSPNVANELASAPTIRTLSAGDKQDIIAFLKTLTDTSYFNKTEWSDPFLLPDPWVE